MTRTSDLQVTRQQSKKKVCGASATLRRSCYDLRGVPRAPQSCAVVASIAMPLWPHEGRCKITLVFNTLRRSPRDHDSLCVPVDLRPCGVAEVPRGAGGRWPVVGCGRNDKFRPYHSARYEISNCGQQAIILLTNICIHLFENHHTWVIW